MRGKWLDCNEVLCLWNACEGYGSTEDLWMRLGDLRTMKAQLGSAGELDTADKRGCHCTALIAAQCHNEWDERHATRSSV